MASKNPATSTTSRERGDKINFGEDHDNGGKNADVGEDHNDKGDWSSRICKVWPGHNTDSCPKSGPMGPRLEVSAESAETHVHDRSYRLEDQSTSTLDTALLNTTPSTWRDPQIEFQGLYLVAPVVLPFGVANISGGNRVDTRAKNSLALTRKETQNNGLESCVHCSRPNFCWGDNADILTNYLAVSLPETSLHTYTIQGIPQSITREKKQRIVKQLVATWPLFKNQEHCWATDHASLVVASLELSAADGGATLQSGESVDSPPIQYFTAGSSAPNQLHVTLQYDGILDFTPYKSFLEGKAAAANIAQLNQALNLIVAKHSNTPDQNGQKTLLQVGTNKFFYKAGWTSLTAGLVAYRGYSSSIRPGMSQVLLNVNKLTAAFFEPDYLHNFIGRWFNIEAGRSLRDDEVREVSKVLQGVRVRIMYNRSKLKGADIDSESQRTKFVVGVGQPLRTQTFTKDGQEVLVRDYLGSTYDHELKFEQLPCINVGSRQAGKQVWLPAEKLWILPHQLYRGKLQGQALDNMINEASKTPRENFTAIVREGLKLLGISPPSQALQSFGITVDDKFIELPARVLIPPDVIYGWDTCAHYTSISNWSLQGFSFYEPKSLPVLHVLNVHEEGKHAYNAGPIAEVFRKTLERYGLQPHTYQLQDLPLRSKQTTTIEDLKKRLRRAFRTVKKSKVVLVLLPDSNSWLYTTIKCIADSEFGIGTVCAQIAKIKNLTRSRETSVENRGLFTFLSNLAMKVNIKLGGTNHIVPLGRFTTLLMEKGQPQMMIVGADVTHPASHSTPGTPSIAAIVASVDPNFTRYPGSMRLQTSKQEFISELGVMIQERLKAWLKAGNAELPTRILLYRDGVSEGQYATMRLREIPQIEQACKDAERFIDRKQNPFGKDPYRPLITYVVVSKRHHTRFYPRYQTYKQNAQYKHNILPGTVVDSGITNTYDFDFYLQAHSVTKGQARPAHYYVLSDDSAFFAYGLQRLTFELCYLYARSTCAVSYVPPAYYADLLCTRGRGYLKALFDGIRREPVTVESVLAERGLWSSRNASGSNPWHKKLDDVMFYL